VNARILASCRAIVLIGALLVIFREAWLAVWALFPPPTACIAPSWYLGRALITALAFHPAIVVQGFVHRRSRWVACCLAFSALVISFAYPIYGTSWGLPAFVGLHLAVALYFAFRASRAVVFGHSHETATKA
jgi:hypothetical protein